jgi:hypothetical protein
MQMTHGYIFFGDINYHVHKVLIETKNSSTGIE